VRWAPTGNGLAFVFENDLYYRRGSDGVVQRITDDGSNATFNGIADWVYEGIATCGQLLNTELL
jgi:hypothetical protein